MRVHDIFSIASQLRERAARLRTEKIQIESFWFEVNLRRIILKAAEELEARGRRVTIRAVVSEIRVDSEAPIGESVIRMRVHAMRLWREHGFRSNAHKHFAAATDRLMENQCIPTVECLARELGITQRAVMRYFIRNPQKAWMLGIRL